MSPLLLCVLAFAGLAALTPKRPAMTPPAPRDPHAALFREIRELYAAMGRALGYPLPPLVFSTDVANAASDGARILVNPVWVRATLDDHCEDRACGAAIVVGIIGHELAHHGYGDAFVPRRSWAERRARERRADRYAGFVVSALGLDASHLEQVLGVPGSCCSRRYDPPWQRALAVREGATLAWTNV
jgi:hypothetical protein